MVYQPHSTSTMSNHMNVENIVIFSIPFLSPTYMHIQKLTTLNRMAHDMITRL